VIPRHTGRTGDLVSGSGTSGFSLVEVVMGLGILAIAVTLAVSPAFAWVKRQRLEGAVRLLAMDLAAARWGALTTGRSTGLVFRPGENGEISWTAHRDGDGDGLGSQDMAAGVDKPLGQARRLSRLAPGVHFGVLAGVSVPRLPPQTGALARQNDPVKFGSADMAVFSPLGSATAGSLYLNNGSNMTALVVNGVTGRLRLFRFQSDQQKWKEMT
jgi:Tfp pilus assembly protein FimT